ncbi:SDR family oxidoreductase [Heyndrickxia oleronia]|uniref:SDR family oxidoreductase n=1 Tax=Heyndrickxia oleronia TaxID=38875 RepID=UPI003CC81433
MNVTKESDIEALVKQTIDVFGRLDYAFNGTGAFRAGTIVDQSEEDWELSVDLCLKGVFLSLKHEANYMNE